MAKTDKLLYAAASVFGLGRFPVAPGTCGSLAGLVLCLAVHANTFVYLAVFSALFAIGVISSGKIEAKAKIKDPSYIVIDEFACIFPVFFLIPLKPLYVVVGFCLYRFFDIVKVFPLKRLESAGGGWGIMLDDLAAALYANLALHLIVFLKVFF